MRLFVIEWPNNYPELVEIVGELKKQGHEILYWSGYKQKLIDKSDFPETVFHDLEDALAARPASGLGTTEFLPPGENLINKMSGAESTIMTMMNKKYERLSVSERKHLYYDMLSYWDSVLRQLKPELIIFWSVPHTVYDFIIYSLAKQMGIKTIMFEYTLIGDQVLVSNEYEEGNKYLKSALAENTREYHLEELSVESREYYLKHTNPDFDLAPHYVQDYLNFYSGWNAVKFKAKLSATSIKDFSFFTKFLSYVAKKFKTDLKKDYRLLQTEPNFNQKFIYAPLHFQPESTTTPLGGVFVDQALLVEILSAAIPDDWLIYVKEHPTQWSPWGGNYSSYRYPNYYQHLARLKNVRFVPITTSSYQLIRHAEAVATVTGTAGWESVLRSKPVLIFGFPWYRHCQGIFKVSDVQSCRLVIDRIKNGLVIEEQAIINYLYFLDKFTFHGYYDSGVQKISKISPAENKNNFLQALLTEIKNLV